MQEVLVVLEEEAVAVEVLERFYIVPQWEIMVVMAQQEVMAEVEGVAVLEEKAEVLVAVALAVLD